jgi:hypothetical protein
VTNLAQHDTDTRDSDESQKVVTLDITSDDRLHAAIGGLNEDTRAWLRDSFNDWYDARQEEQAVAAIRAVLAEDEPHRTPVGVVFETEEYPGGYYLSNWVEVLFADGVTGRYDVGDHARELVAGLVSGIGERSNVAVDLRPNAVTVVDVETEVEWTLAARFHLPQPDTSPPADVQRGRPLRMSRHHNRKDDNSTMDTNASVPPRWIGLNAATPETLADSLAYLAVADFDAVAVAVDAARTRKIELYALTAICRVLDEESTGGRPIGVMFTAEDYPSGFWIGCDGVVLLDNGATVRREFEDAEMIFRDLYEEVGPDTILLVDLRDDTLTLDRNPSPGTIHSKFSIAAPS